MMHEHNCSGVYLVGRRPAVVDLDRQEDSVDGNKALHHFERGPFRTLMRGAYDPLERAMWGRQDKQPFWWSYSLYFQSFPNR